MSLKHNEIYEKLLNNRYIGIAVHEMIYDKEGKPDDYRFIDLNSTFEKITGFKKEEIIGNTIKSIIPNIEEEWIIIFGEAVKSGKESYFERYQKEIGKCLKVHVYSYENNKFVTLIIDATEDYSHREFLKEEVIRNNIAAKAAKIAFFKYDIEKRQLSVSDYWYDLIGAKNKVIDINKYFLTHLHPDNLERLSIDMKSIKHFSEYQCEFRIYNEKKKKYIWMRHSSVLVLNTETNKRELIIGIHQDIDDERKSKEEIEKLVKMLDLGMRNGGIDLWDYEAESDLITFRSYNDFSSGGSRRSFLLSEHIERINEEDAGDFLKQINSVNSQGKNTINAKYRIYSQREQKEIWVSNNGRVIKRDFKGHVTHAVGITQDITDRVEREQELVLSQKRLKLAHKIAHLGGWEYYTEQDRFVLSEEALELLDLPLDEEHYSISKLERMLGIEQKEQLQRFVNNMMKMEQYEDEFYIQTEQRIKKFHVIAVRNVDVHGKIINIMGTFQDVTERNSLEERLRQAEKMTAVGQLAGGIAHDFNNILMATGGYAELIKYNSTDAKIIEYCNRIMYSAMSSAELTKKLLAFSRKDSLIKTKTSIHECICSAFEILNITIDRKIQIELDFTAANDWVIGDSSELQNIIINMCLNSRDAMPNGGFIKIFTKNLVLDKENKNINEFVLEEGEYILIKVEDSGCGIEKENRKKIFEPFFTTKEIGKGTGLGLSAIYGTVVSHDGAITVESEIGKGTCFDILLPVIN